MYRFFRLAILLSGAAAMIVPIKASTVVDLPFTGGGGFTNVELAASWTQTATHDGVTITADISNPSDPNITATAWLTTSIGPSANPADVVATTPITSDTLFTGLNLGPGTYYLVVSLEIPNLSNSYWMYDDPAPASPTTAADVTLGSSYIGSFFDFPSFGPSESFVPFNDLQLVYTVTDTSSFSSVPEPFSCLLLGSGLTCIGAFARLRRRTS